jgi:hypothetical protein
VRPNNENGSQRDDRLRTDISTTVWQAPLRVGSVAVGHLLATSLIVTRSGPETLGIWGFLYAMAMLGEMGSVSLGPQIQRLVVERGRYLSQEAWEAVDRGISDGRTFFTLSIAGFNCFALVVALSLFELPTSHVTLIGCFLLVASSGILGARTFVYDGLLSAIGFASRVQSRRALASAAGSIGLVLSALHPSPLLLLCLSAALIQALSLVMLRRVCQRLRPRARSRAGAHVKGSLTAYARYARQFADFNLLAIANQGRDPLFRATVISVAGPGVAGIFDVGYRLVRVARDMVLTGTQSLVGHMASDTKGFDVESVANRMSHLGVSTLYIGTAALAGTVALGPYVLSVWVPEIAINAWPPAAILIVWGLLTLPNVPFWYRLLAAHGERPAWVAVGLHALVAIGAFAAVAHSNTPLSTDVLAVRAATAWLVGGVVTQGVVYWACHRDPVARRVLADRRWRTATVVWFAGCIGAILILSLPAPQELRMSAGFAYAAACLIQGVRQLVSRERTPAQS